MNFGVVVIIDYREAPNVMLVSFENRYAGVEKQKINPSMWGLGHKRQDVFVRLYG